MRRSFAGQQHGHGERVLVDVERGVLFAGGACVGGV